MQLSFHRNDINSKACYFKDVIVIQTLVYVYLANNRELRLVSCTNANEIRCKPSLASDNKTP